MIFCSSKKHYSLSLQLRTKYLTILKYIFNLKNKTKGIFNKKFSAEFEQKKDVWKAYIKLSSTYQYIDFLKDKLAYYDDFSSYPLMKKYIGELKAKIKLCIDNYSYFWQFQKWKRYFNNSAKHIQKLVAAIETQAPDKRMYAFKSWYLNEKLKKLYN